MLIFKKKWTYPRKLVAKSETWMECEKRKKTSYICCIVLKKKLAANIYHKVFWRLVNSEKENTNNIELSGQIAVTVLR